MSTGSPTCPRCGKSGFILKYPAMTKLNPLSPFKLFAKAVKGEFEEVTVVCPICGHKAPHGDFFR